MTLDTWTGLKADVANWLNRGDLTASIPTFITLAEAQMAREFVSGVKKGRPIPRRLKSRSDVIIDVADEYISVPPRFQSPITFMLEGAPPIVLDYLDPLTLLAAKRAARHTGKPPRFYTVLGDELQIYPVADIAYTGEIFFASRVTPLSAENESNWVLQDHPDAYLYGALMQAAPYLKDDPRLAVWGGLFNAAVSAICDADPMPTSKAKLSSGIPHAGCAGYSISSDE